MTKIVSATRAEFATAIGRLHAAGAGHWAPVLTAVGAGRLALFQTPRGTQRVRAKTLQRIGRPLLIVIGDDDYGTTGPGGFVDSVLATVFRPARAVFVHGAGATPADYGQAAQTAERTGWAVLVETSASAVDAWLAEAAQRAPKAHLTFIGARDGLHPLPLVRN